MRTVHISISAMVCCIWAAGALAATPATRPAVDAQIAAGSITLPGTASGWLQTNAYARVEGIVSQWHVDMGDHVNQGQVLATIDTPDIDALLEIAKVKLELARAEFHVCEITLELAKITANRFSQAPAGAVAQPDVEQKRAELDSCTAKLAVAKAQVNLAEAEVKKAEGLASFKTVLAPFSGVINSRRIDIGDYVTVGTPLFGLAQSDRIRVFVDVPQKAGAQIQLGSPATVASSDIPDRTFAGRVTRAAQAIDPTTGTRRFEVDLDNRSMALLPGMFVNVSFELGQGPH